MKRPFSFIPYEFRNPPDENGSSGRVVYLDLEDFGSIGESNGLGESGLGGEFVWSESVDVCNGETAESVADERNVCSFDVFDDHDFLLHEIVCSQVTDCVPENGLLNEQYIGPTLDYLLDESEDVFPFLLENPVDLGVVPDYYVVVDGGLGRGNAELDDCDFGRDYFGRHSLSTHGQFVWEHQSRQETSVISGSS